MMKIVKGRPPNYPQILAVFPMASRPSVIFAYGDTIYNPSGNPISPALIAHEEVHGERQRAMGVEKWWQLYLTDSQFRYDEELLAHRAEYQRMLGGSRSERRGALDEVAKKLASPLYGGMTSTANAKAALV